MKHGPYRCGCGKFTLFRGRKTRKEYAVAKKEHAEGGGDVPGCEFLKKELARSQPKKN
jgi:hypothetical protein